MGADWRDPVNQTGGILCITVSCLSLQRYFQDHWIYHKSIQIGKIKKTDKKEEKQRKRKNKKKPLLKKEFLLLLVQCDNKVYFLKITSAVGWCENVEFVDVGILSSTDDARSR